MKYAITAYRHESRDIEVIADDPVSALKLAHESNPGFRCDEATELLGKDEFGDDVIGKSFSVVGQCESCNKVLFDGDEYSTTEDDVDVCQACISEFESEV